MSTRWTTGLSILGAAALLAACQRLPREEVLMRAPSPDGRMEAVLMFCHAPPAVASIEILGAVFVREEGRTFGCDDIPAAARASFSVTTPATPSKRPETIEWIDGRAVFTLYGRGIVSQEHQHDAGGLVELRLLEPPAME
jgi:hypothetical protein